MWCMTCVYIYTVCVVCEMCIYVCGVHMCVVKCVCISLQCVCESIMEYGVCGMYLWHVCIALQCMRERRYVDIKWYVCGMWHLCTSVHCVCKMYRCFIYGMWCVCVYMVIGNNNVRVCNYMGRGVELCMCGVVCISMCGMSIYLCSVCVCVCVGCKVYTYVICVVYGMCIYLCSGE